MRIDLLKMLKKYCLDRESLLFGPVYFFLAFINLTLKLRLTPAWFNGILARNHYLLLQFKYTNNEQSRILQFYLPEMFRRLFGLTVVHAYMLQRFLFVFLALVLFHKFLRKWFSVPISFAGVLFLAAVMPLSYMNHLQESAPLLLLTFLLGLWAIRANNLPAIILALLVGGLNNETVLVLPLVYLLYNFKSWKIGQLAILAGKTFLISGPMLVGIGVMRYLTRFAPHLGGAWHLPDNLLGLFYHLSMNMFDFYRANYLFIFFIFGVFWFYALMDYKTKPLFLRRAALMVPFFIIAHLVTGIIAEVRQMLPLGFIIIPMALFYLFPQDKKQAAG